MARRASVSRQTASPPGVASIPKERFPMHVRILLTLLGLLLPVSLAAQEQTGALQGRVTDSSGGVLPGVTVTVAGATIIGGSMVAITSETGNYRVPNIPIGAYTVTFELAGFGSVVREGIRIQAGTTFTLNATLGAAALHESVTVSGAAPMIETAATAVGFNFGKEVMETIPNARDAWSMVAQAPGVVSSTVNVGGTQTGNQSSFRGHGVDPRQNTYVLNGANVTDNTNNGGSQFFFDVDSFDEMQVSVSSHSAEVQTPGMVLNIVPKSGTNSVSGAANLYWGGDQIQSDNVDDDLRRRGVDRASNLHQYLDTGFDVGGPIVRDRAWFWGAYRFQEVENFITGTTNPDGSFPIDRTYLWYPSAKVNWKPVASHNVSAYFNMAQKKRFNRGLSALRPVETTWDQQGAPIARLFTFRDDWTIGSNLLVSLKANLMDQGFELRAQEGVDVQNTPAQLDAATGIWSAAPPNELSIGKNARTVAATANYYVENWFGQHDVKVGLDFTNFNAFGNKDGTVAQTTYPADHRLTFFNREPLEVTLFASGAQSVRNPTRSAFVQDAWKVGRVTLSLGARWDWQANSLAGVTAPQSRFFPEAVRQEETGNLITWNTLAPRLGVIYDLTGSARTVLKGSYSRYYWQLWTEKGAQASAAGDRSLRYEWRDLNGDRQFTIDEAGALLAVTDPATRLVTIDPDLAPTKTDEITVGISHELLANASVTANFMYRKDRDLNWLIHPSISPADYTAVQGVDPGLDGRRGTADDGGTIEFYELDAAKRTLSPNFLTTRRGFEQEYRGFEVTLQKRLANKWQLVGSFTAGEQRENYGAGSFQNPQDVDKMDGRPIDDSTPYVAKVMGSYVLPYNITFSGFYQYVAGNGFTRTVNSASAVGRSLNQGNVTALAGPRSDERYDALSLLDLRVGYDLRFRGAGLALQFDIFNALNTNTVTTAQVLSGPAFGRVITFVPPRIFRFGAKIRF
jgi:carboxypeptidase family protein/TonB-dependent receptor-like protein